LSHTSIVARSIRIEPNFTAWREAARPLLQQGAPPELVDFVDSATPGSDLLFQAELPAAEVRATQRVPPDFLRRAETVSHHRSPERWNLLYRLLWRLQTDRDLLRIEVDDDVIAFRRLEHQVARDLHKMHAFVRFRRVIENDQEAFIAWHQPDHFILPLAAPFFAERFAIMRWSIFTPDASMRWNPETKDLQFGPGVPKEMAPQADGLEDLWRTYYGSIFNPARTNLRAMRAEMPARYWKNLPEIQNVPGLLAQADQRIAGMIEHSSPLQTTSWVPQEHSLPLLREAISRCRGCDLHACATQAVFGAGTASASLVMVGEQPGDEEDRRGQPFIGPAGHVLDQLLAEAEIDRDAIYLTNAVKHFKFVLRGKRRLHESPRLSEINACRPWLLAELDALQPSLVVCLGASAAKSLLGAKFALMRDRGKVVASPWAPRVLATLHPSAILRADDPNRAAELRALLLADLRQAKSLAS
jgi:uracil-DNA glycosylase